MKALTLHQPWAAVVFPRWYSVPRKEFETRGWAPPGELPLRDLAIHAGGRWTLDQAHLCYRHPFRSALGLELTAAAHSALMRETRKAAGLELGAVVGVVDVVKVWRTEDLVRHASQFEDGAAETWWEEFKFGDFTAGRFAWELRNVRRLLDPVACRGWQRVWNLPPKVEEAVRAQLRAA